MTRGLHAGTYYQTLTGFEKAYIGEPQTSVWQQATSGTLSEW